MPAVSRGLDLGTPQITAPLQLEKFFIAERLEMDEVATISQPFLIPKLALSHDVREDEFGRGVTQTTHMVHGEAGGELNLFGKVSLLAVAKIPVYVFENTGRGYLSEGTSSSELLKNPARFSWRSELAVPLSQDMDLSLFYDRSSMGSIDRHGLNERDEKFGTRIIFRFK